MLQGVWIFILFIFFNPGAKELFCGSISSKAEPEMRMNELEEQEEILNESNNHKQN